MGAEDMIYEQVDAWKRISESRVCRYRCFRVWPSGRYCVQSADFYNVPLDHVHAFSLQQQYIELLAEEAPDERAPMYDSLEEAIRAHDAEFGN